MAGRKKFKNCATCKHHKCTNLCIDRSRACDGKCLLASKIRWSCVRRCTEHELDDFFKDVDNE